MNPPKQDLREISHLFLSSVRERQTSGAQRPQRLSPQQRADQAVDLSPDELAQVAAGRTSGRDATRVPGAAGETAPVPPAHVTCLLGGHLGNRLHDRAKQFAAGLSRSSQRVAMVEVDACELRVIVFERNPHGAPHVAADLAVAEPLDGQRIAQVIDELAWDVSRWVVVLPQNPRTPEARCVIHAAASFTLLATGDAEGTVAAYRTIKGLADVLKRDGKPLPRLSLALLDVADDPGQASAAHQKLSGVATQFLGWSIEREAPVPRPTPDIAEHLVLNSRASHDKAQAANAPQWQIVAELVSRSGPLMQDTPMQDFAVQADHTPAELEALTRPIEPARVEPTQPSTLPLRAASEEDDVIELPPTTGDESSAVLSAVLAGSLRTFAVCPIAPPNCPEAKLTVTRERCLALVASAGRGLSKLRAAAQAYEWVRQNRSLIAMALPQFAIDAHAMPRLTLLIDHADADAAELRGIIASGSVSILTYRKLRWSGRTGLLLNAA